MGQVWLAEKHGSSGFLKLMAVKTIRRERIPDTRQLEMFLDEARLVANLIHPNIVQVYQLFRARREVFIIMEHVFGVTLLQILDVLAARGPSIPMDVGTHVIARVCHGLDYAHKKCDRNGRHLGIVHRDICPSNIMISHRGIPKLTDFGVAKAVTSTVDDEGNVVWGKFAYMSPEAARREGTDPRSDVYSLGLVMYEMFTGRVAHDAGSTRALLGLIGGQGPRDRDPRNVLPDFPEPLATIILKATDPDPDQRYQTALELARALEMFLLTHFLFPDEERLSNYLATLFPVAKKHRWW
jgi:serine/threonine protein kinase